ncbi:hypothetical protein OBBRIDRAFT_373631 [Obba rivulosa]|uniref:Uncharacterized protein n=1 Tax=Obba rivulosa TaxID=1052685 RepID=A0A8E2AHZ6_9APHY|nr:hypothetical protein OBBRIDRAFT_373631 [Obba rivulosa]
MGILYTLFPGITSMEFGDGFRYRTLPERMPEQWEQYRSQNETRPLNGRWSHLQSLSGGVEDVYAVALTCQVDHLTVHFAIDKLRSSMPSSRSQVQIDSPPTQMLSKILMYSIRPDWIWSQKT